MQIFQRRLSEGKKILLILANRKFAVGSFPLYKNNQKKNVIVFQL